MEKPGEATQEVHEPEMSALVREVSRTQTERGIEMKIELPLRFGPQAVYVEMAELKKAPVEPPHITHNRENDGAWVIKDANHKRLFTVAFQGKAKRGQAFNAPDPEGYELAKLLVDLLTKHTKGESR